MEIIPVGLRIRYPQEMTFSGFKFCTKADTLNRGVPKQFSIEYKSEGRWKKAYEAIGNMKDNVKKDFDTSIKSRYWRFKVDSVVSKGVPVKISEWELIE